MCLHGSQAGLYVGSRVACALQTDLASTRCPPVVYLGAAAAAGWGRPHQLSLRNRWCGCIHRLVISPVGGTWLGWGGG